MALSKPLVELLATIKDEGRRKIIIEEFEANQGLQSRFEGNLRQEDYDRQLNSHKTTLAQVEAAKLEAEKSALKWQQWAERNIPVHERLIETNAAVQAERDRLAAQVKEMTDQAANGGDGEIVDKNQLNAIVNQRIEEFKRTNGAPTAAQIQQIVTDTATKMAQGLEDKFLKETFPTSMNTVLQSTNFQIKHYQEFGEAMDPMAFMQFLGERHIATPTQKDYDEFVRPQREAAQKVAHEKEIEQRVADAVKQERSRQNVPGSAITGNPEELGPVQQFQRQRQQQAQQENGNGAGKLPADLELGTNAAAMEAAAFLRQAGKV